MLISKKRLQSAFEDDYSTKEKMKEKASALFSHLPFLNVIAITHKIHAINKKRNRLQ